MKIYVDFDDVLCETALRFTELARDLFGIDLPYSRVRFFDMQKTFGLTNAQYEQLMAAGHTERNLLTLEETPGAAGVLNRWMDKGHRVQIITGRPYSAYSPSRAWLDSHGLSRVPLTCVDKYGRERSAEKPAFGMTLAELYALDFDLAVEDSPAAFQHLQHFEHCTAAVFDRPWNRQEKLPDARFVRCADWAAVERLAKTAER